MIASALPRPHTSDRPLDGAQFDPQHPYAFVPPDYDSLPKEPPKYTDIDNTEGATSESTEGASNAAFEADTPDARQTENPAEQSNNSNTAADAANNPVGQPTDLPPAYEAVPVHI